MTDGTSNFNATSVNNTGDSNTPAKRATGAYLKAASRKTRPFLTVIGALLAVAVLLVITAPANAAVAPSGFTATAGDTQVTLTWNNPNDNTITGYQVLQVAIDKLTGSTSSQSTVEREG